MEEAYQFYVEWGIACIIGILGSLLTDAIKAGRKKRNEHGKERET